MSQTISTKLPESVTISDKVLSTPIGESLMLLDLTEGVYFELEEVGARMWQLLSEHKTPAQVAQLVSVEYGVNETSVSADLGELLDQLSSSGLVSISGATDESAD